MTAQSPRAPSLESPVRHRQPLLPVAAGVAFCLAVAPTHAVAAAVMAAAVVTTASPAPTPSCQPAPCVDAPATHLTLTQTADRATAALGDTVTYTVTIGNTGSLPATGVTVDDALGGDAGFVAEDGTGGTTDTFVGAPLTTITRILTGLYRWSYAAVSPGDSDVVRFNAIIKAGSASTEARVVTLTSTASTPGVLPVTVSTTATQPAAAHVGGAVKGTTGIPSTGSGVAAAAAGFLLLGGLGVILIAMLIRRRDELAG